jgi:hypothetical protein
MGSLKTLGKKEHRRGNIAKETLNSGPSAGMGSLKTLGKKEH